MDRRKVKKKTYSSSSSDSELDIKPAVVRTTKDYGPNLPVTTKNGHYSLSYYTKSKKSDLPPPHKQPASSKRQHRPPDRYGTYF